MSMTGAHQGISFNGIDRDHQLEMVQGRSIGRSSNSALDSKQSECPVDGVEERVVLRQEQRLTTPQNYFWSVHSRRLRRQEDPLRGSRSRRTAPALLLLVGSSIFPHELVYEPSSLWGMVQIVQDAGWTCNADGDDFSHWGQGPHYPVCTC